jgi:hypothetical protein
VSINSEGPTEIYIAMILSIIKPEFKHSIHPVKATQFVFLCIILNLPKDALFDDARTLKKNELNTLLS